MTKEKMVSVDEYLATLAPERQEIVGNLRRVIKAAAPDAQEKISYAMPYYHLHGRLAYFCAFTNHYSFFVMKHVVITFREKIKKWERGAATLQFKYDEPLPEALITEMIQYAAQYNREQAKLKQILKQRKF